VPHLDDASLVNAARSGDRKALATLIERHWALLLGCCRRMLGGDDLVEEAAQETVVQALLGLERLREPDRFGPWLAGIGLNVCRQLLRERSSRSWWPEAAVDDPAVSGGADPQELAEAAELAARVREAVAGLPRGQREAVTLHYLAGLTQREVAAALGIDVGAVKGRLHKARSALRHRLFEPEEAIEMAQTQADGAVEARVADVLRKRLEGGGEPRYVVVLQEVGGERRLPIWIGPYEAQMLAAQLESLQAQRPDTYTLAARVMEASGATLDEVRISRLTDTVFYAEVRVTSAAGATRTIDARPSDALNLALRLDRPVRVEPEVFEAARPDVGEVDNAGEALQGASEIARDIVERTPAAGRLFEPGEAAAS
jgi:RNA polymerase sigma-70 factor (ECF subfamily)